MSKKILVAYATRAGTTAEVADFIGKTLVAGGIAAEVVPADTVGNLDGYDGVILGTGIRAGKTYGEAFDFVKRHDAALKSIPVAFFVVCLTMKDDIPENRATVDAYLNPMRAVVTPVDCGLFAGKMDFSELGFIVRFIVRRMVKAPEGDFRDWDKIGEWADSIQEKLGL